MEYREITTLKAQTEHALKTRPETRNSDAELIQVVCGMFRAKDGSHYDPIQKATSIERCRRWFNQRGQYLPTIQEVAEQRRLNMDEWRVAMGYPTQAGMYKPPSETREKTRFTFPSATQRSAIYEVQIIGQYVTCTCPSFGYRKECRHVKTAFEERRNAVTGRLF